MFCTYRFEPRGSWRKKKKKKRKIDISGVFVRSGQRLSSSFTFHVARGQIKPDRWLSF